MSARLRHTASAARVAQVRIGAFPRGGNAPGGPARDHAARHWTDALGRVGRGQVNAETEGAVVLAFIGELAGQVQACRRCKQGSGIDPTPPEQWAWWALRQVKATRAATEGPVRELARRVRRPGRTG